MNTYLVKYSDGTSEYVLASNEAQARVKAWRGDIIQITEV